MRKTPLIVLFALSVFHAMPAAAQEPPPPAALPPAALPPAPPPPAGALPPGPPPPAYAVPMGPPGAMPTSPPSEEPPSKGTGFLITGIILSGVGVVNLAASPICKTDLVDPEIQNGCLVASLVLGGTLVAVGVPLIIVGVNKRSTYNEWKARHPVASGFGVAPVRSGGALTFQSQF
jgi:hypothetical protein